MMSVLLLLLSLKTQLIQKTKTNRIQSIKPIWLCARWQTKKKKIKTKMKFIIEYYQWTHTIFLYRSLRPFLKSIATGSNLLDLPPTINATLSWIISISPEHLTPSMIQWYDWSLEMRKPNWIIRFWNRKAKVFDWNRISKSSLFLSELYDKVNIDQLPQSTNTYERKVIKFRNQTRPNRLDRFEW